MFPLDVDMSTSYGVEPNNIMMALPQSSSNDISQSPVVVSAQDINNINYQDMSQPSSVPSSTPLFTSTPPSDTGTESNHDDAGFPFPDTARDIAIVGMAVRAPGGNNSPEQLWDYLLQKGDASGEMPPMRWEPYHSRHPRNAQILAKTTSKGYFLDRVQDFDAAFFSISPREAEQMDPQQRITLEVAWEALEDAGIAPDRLSGSDTAVFMGVNSDDYGKLILEDLENVGAHMGVGTAYCGIPSRVSYQLNLMGPSLAVDAACASSLVAIHQARQALLAGETELALAGGVNALIGPGLTRVLDEAGAIADDGRCRSFDDSAHGYGRGEGAGIVVMKRLDRALADGDRIHGVLKGTAVCGDGKTVGIMAPNSAAQRLVARKALKDARTTANSISYIEAHATSTPLGDPTEMEALAEVYGGVSSMQGDRSCYVGSIKPNIGHLEAAAGVLGLIKSVLVLKHGLVPGQANLEKHSTKINWQNHNLVVTKTSTKLKAPTRLSTPVRAAIASYGYSGTVSHAIIEAGPKTSAVETEAPVASTENLPVLLFLSAPQANRLPEAARSLAEWLKSAAESISLQSIANTLAARRNHHKFRVSITATTRVEAISALEKFAENNIAKEPHIAMTGSQRVPAETAKRGVVWVFSGHGAQWPGMGKELMATQPLFSSTIQRLHPIVQRELGFDLIEALSSAREDHSSDEVQIMTYAMHIALASVLFEEAGAPAAVVGHSLGETAAAVVSGALNFEEGALVACTRARLYRRHMGTGAMGLVSISAADMNEQLAARQVEDIDIAIESSPTSCVIAGSLASVAKLSSELMEAGIQVRPLSTDIAFHSRALLDLVEPLRESLDGNLHPRTPTTRLYSTSTPDARSAHPRDTEYWVNNMVQPVLLHSTIKAIGEDGYRAFVEVSSHPIVAHSVSETLEEGSFDNGTIFPAMLRRKPALKQMLTAVGKLHTLGYQVSYTTKGDKKPWAPEVPRTKWSHVPYWRDVAKVPLGQLSAHDPSSNTLLGSKTTVSGTRAGHVLFQTSIDESTKPFPGNHPLHGSEIVPAAVLVNTFLHAIDTSAYCLEGVSLKVPVVVSPARQVQLLLEEGKNITLTSRLAESGTDSSSNGGAWLVNTTSRVAPVAKATAAPTLDLAEIKSRLASELSTTFSIDYLAQVGVPEMGFPWAVQSHTTNGRSGSDDYEMLAHVFTNPGNAITSGFEDLGASIMDAATSIASTIFHEDPLLRMPTSIGRVTNFGFGWEKYPHGLESGYIYCRRKKTQTAAEAVCDITVCSEDGQVVVEFDAMAFAGIEPPNSDHHSADRKSTNGLVHRIAWTPSVLSETPLDFHNVVLFSPGDDDGDDELSLADFVSPYARLFQAKGYSTSWAADAADLAGLLGAVTKPSIVLHIPRAPQSTMTAGIAQAASRVSEGLVSAIQAIAATGNSQSKLFSLIVTNRGNPSKLDLAFGPLYGLARIVKSEMPDIFGGLFDMEKDGDDLTRLLVTGIKYVQGHDVVRYEDGVPRAARLRTIKPESSKTQITTFSPAGTYLITGGLGALGLQVAQWMVERGARRLLLVSRRQLPHRREWKTNPTEMTDKIAALEALGATVHVLAVDISQPDADVSLTAAIDALSLPAIKGVVHAAGVLRDQTVDEITTEAFDAVLAPKVTGALHLHNLFPVGSVDFFTLFSSCGQLLGFPGQGSYASANSFLDALAAHRGDEATKAILWTSWRGLGMAASTDYINAELEARGITDVTADEAFMAWDVIGSACAGLNSAVVLRALPIEADEEPPCPILAEISPRRERVVVASTNEDAAAPSGTSAAGGTRPASGPELEQYLLKALQSAAATTLGSSDDDGIDPTVALAEMGMDSVLTVSFRTLVQKRLKVKMAPTLVWKCPTIEHLVKHFVAELSA